MSAVDLDTIAPNDVVTVADTHGNRVQGFVMVDQNGALLVSGFGTSIPFARPNRNGRMVLNHGLRIHDHQPQLFLTP